MYEAINQPVFSYLPTHTKRVLDIGCGAGNLGEHIKKHRDCEVFGITYSQLEAEIASRVLDLALVADLNSSLALSDLGQFDCIICSHVLEHLYQPQHFLMQLHNLLTPDGKLILALPNVLYWKQRLEFFKGNFRYSEGGLMDRTHFRFFDWQTAQDLVIQSGYQILQSEADGCFPLPAIRKFLPISTSHRIDKAALTSFPGLFGFQFVFFATPA
jgi:SAM-dependent methyltransferase